MSLTPRPGIMEIEAYVGGEAGVKGLTEVIRLASNENPLGPSASAVEAYARLAGELHRYPDGGHHGLRAAISTRYGLPTDQIVCGAGSDELITLLVRGYAGPGDEVLYSHHGFLMYPISARSVGAVPISAEERNLTAEVDSLLAKVSERTRIVFLANPNNPTGSYLPLSELERLRAGLPKHVLLAIDAAYAEYVEADDYDDGSSLVKAHDNVVMLRTFSKIHGLAALRLGWAFCPPEVASVLNRLRGPFNVTAAAQAAGIASLEDPAHQEESKRHNTEWRAWFVAELARLNLRAEPSQGNFVLVRFADAPAAAAFLKERGILVRRMDSYHLPGHLRITIGTEADMRAVAAALAELDQ